MRDVCILYSYSYTPCTKNLKYKTFPGISFQKKLSAAHTVVSIDVVSPLFTILLLEVPKQNKGPNGIKLGLVYSTSTACIVVSHLIRECFKHSTESENELEILKKEILFFSLYTCKSSKLYDCPAKVTGDQ